MQPVYPPWPPETSVGQIDYVYDGSFQGLLCCVFRSYTQREIPASIQPDMTGQTGQMSLFASCFIESDRQQYERVLASVPKRIGANALTLIRNVYLSCLEEKEMHILRFLRFGYANGPRVLRMLSNDYIAPLLKAQSALRNEAHMFKEFCRFSDASGILISKIAPKNMVLPHLAEHFCSRLRNESFAIYDEVHDMVLLGDHGRAKIMWVEQFEMPDPSPEELVFRRLWKMYYNTIPIAARENRRCQMSHMPKRYWANMTEFTESFCDPLPEPDPQAVSECPRAICSGEVRSEDR